MMARNWPNFCATGRMSEGSRQRRGNLERRPRPYRSQGHEGRPTTGIADLMGKTAPHHALRGLLFAFLFGCVMVDQNISTDLTAFQNLVTVPLHVKAVRWEVFSTPENTGGVPGPTDYVTLVAEIEPASQPDLIKGGQIPAQLDIVPGSARPWLDGRFRALLLGHANRVPEMSDASRCGPIRARLRKTNEPVSGFVCILEEKTLLYLTLLDHG
jgi:hypothetical protein